MAGTGRIFQIRGHEFHARGGDPFALATEIETALKRLPWQFRNSDRIRIDGGADDDALFAAKLDLVQIRGNGGADFLRGGAGHDKIFGGAGDDVLRGGRGDDALQGGAGDDRIYGGAGNDWIRGGAGDDLLVAGRGLDRMRGDAGDDHLIGNDSPFNKLYGGSGNDLIEARGGADWVWAQGGDDVVMGGDGYDIIHGGAGDDTLYAGAGGDTLRGNDGDDVLISVSDAGTPTRMAADRGGIARGKFTWDDILTGGDGADSFVFRVEMNARREIAARNLRDDGTVDWRAVMDENDNRHDHWVDWLGTERIRDYDRAEGDGIVIEGHSVALQSIRHIDRDGDGVTDLSVIRLVSDQSAMVVNAAVNGAHHGDLLGVIKVEGDAVYAEDLVFDASRMYAAFDTLDGIG